MQLTNASWCDNDTFEAVFRSVCVRYSVFFKYLCNASELKLHQRQAKQGYVMAN